MLEQSKGAKEVINSMSSLVSITEKIKNSIIEQRKSGQNITDVVSHLNSDVNVISDSYFLLSDNTSKIKNTFNMVKESSNNNAMFVNKLFNLIDVFKVDISSEKLSSDQTEVVKAELKRLCENMIKYLDSVYLKVTKKEITLEQAKEICKKYLLSQKVGTKGYFCGLKPNAQLEWHPNKEFEGKKFDISDPKFYFIHWMVKKETGYYEYIWWENEILPNGQTKLVFNEKVLYQIYYEPFDLLIYPTAYKTDFGLITGNEEKSLTLRKE